MELILPLIAALLAPAADAVAQNDPIEAIATLRAYARASLPPASKAGRLARVVDQSNVICLDDGSWLSERRGAASKYYLAISRT